jgi:hypothetical protein
MSSRAWAFANAASWFMVRSFYLTVTSNSHLVQVFVRTQVAPWDATGSFCISLAPLAITYGLHSLSNNTVISMRRHSPLILDILDN